MEAILSSERFVYLYVLRYCSRIPSILKMEETRFSKTLIPIYQTAYRHTWKPVTLWSIFKALNYILSCRIWDPQSGGYKEFR
jgi:hypothetical protein